MVGRHARERLENRNWERRRESHVYLDFEEEWIAAQTMADRNKDWQER
jgi:hypothetical protein